MTTSRALVLSNNLDHIRGFSFPQITDVIEICIREWQEHSKLKGQKILSLTPVLLGEGWQVQALAMYININYDGRSVDEALESLLIPEVEDSPTE